MLLVVLFFSGLCACSSANIPFFSAGWKNLKCWLKTQECFLNFAVIRNSIRSQYNIFWRNIQPNICICFMRIIISWTLIISRTAKREITRVHAGGRRRSGDLGPPRAVSTSQQRSFLNFFFFLFSAFYSLSALVFLLLFFTNKPICCIGVLNSFLAHILHQQTSSVQSRLLLTFFEPITKKDWNPLCPPHSFSCHNRCSAPSHILGLSFKCLHSSYSHPCDYTSLCTHFSVLRVVLTKFYLTLFRCPGLFLLLLPHLEVSHLHNVILFSLLLTVRNHSQLKVWTQKRGKGLEM